ncbi:ricin-type beta-trefoil lectin domain protein, partial [Kitasatospora sp. NPDC002227]|uniref:ricin-type beta-trefoil lectin domain protein n=1 Tax=Kitasatospora sp. NPDC002227 TaxID=3154773 RepID=UPI003319B5B7
HFPISADGLNVTTDTAGNISLKDAKGKTRLHAPTPLQWDSTPAAPVPPLTGAKTTRTLSAFAAPAAAATPAPTGESTSQGPGEGAHEAKIAVKADSAGFDLTPDQNVLGKGTGPWYIDPTISADSPTAHSAQVQEYHSTTSYYDSVSDLGTGYCGYSDCTGSGRERAYFSIAVNSAIYNQPSGAPSAPTVYSSTLYANADGASSPGTNTPLGLYWTNGIGPGVTWANQPCGGSGTFGGCSKIGNSYWITGTGPINYDVTWHMQQAAINKWGALTVGIAPDDENNKYYRHHIASNPHITTNYDLQPSAWYPRTSPQPGFASTNKHNDCQTLQPDGSPAPYAWYNPGWVGANQNIQLALNDWSPAGLPLHGHFHMWDDNDSTWSFAQDTATTGSYNTEVMPVGSLTDGHQYGWVGSASDGQLTSPDTSWCYFRVDKTPPTVGVSSTDFPPSGTPNPTPAKYASDTGTFTLQGNDPAPGAGLNASGLACFKVSTSSTPVTGWHCGDQGTVTADGTGKASYTAQPTAWGTNTLYVQGQDNAGNYSQPAVYNYYAPWNPASKPVFGDVTGDGKPDIVLPDGNGNLRTIQNTGDPTNAGWVSALGVVAPGGSWTNAQVTHRSTLRTPVFPSDDLVVHKPGDKMMFLYTNTGQGHYGQATPFYPSGSATPVQVNCVDTSGAAVDPTGPQGCPTGVGLDFSQVSQVLALGNPDKESTAAPLSKTSLVVVINGSLWLMPPGGAATLLKKTDTQLSNKPWDGSANTDGYDLIGPGPASGTWAANGVTSNGDQATLWARDRRTGQILAYAITKTTATGATNYGNLADPAAISTPTTPGATVIGANVDPATYPTVGSVGDFTGDGVPDLYAQNSAGKVVVWPGVVGDPAQHPGQVTGFGQSYVVGDPRGPQGRYLLAGNANDLTGQNNGTVKSDVTFTSANLGGGTAPAGSTNAAVFNSATTFDPKTSTTWGEVDSGLRVDTQKSFTVTAWAKEDQSTDGVVVSQDGASTSNFMIWPGTFQTGVTTWTFGMSTSDSGWSYDHTNPLNNNTNATQNAAARVQLGVWTKLTASYDATTGQMNLFVNGALAATGRHTTTMAPTGSLVIGRYLNGGKPNNPWLGGIADVAVYPYATLPGSTAGPVVSGVGSNLCMDENGGVPTPGTKIQVWTCNGSSAQTWTFNADGTVSLPWGGCMDATNSGTYDGTPIQWNTCWGNAQSNKAQQFVPRADGTIFNPGSGKCVSDPNGNLTLGTQLVLWACNTAPDQNWTLKPSS